MRAFVCLMLVLCCACGQETVSPGQYEEVEIVLHVTGGFAAADYSVSFQSATGQLLGVSCTNLCDFDPGQVLQRLSQSEVAYIMGLFEAADIPSRSGTDFGTQCCDQFYYDVSYTAGDVTSRVEGSSELLPQSLREAVAVLQAMVTNAAPVVVDFSTPADRWSRDILQIRDAGVQDQTLEVVVEYGGGCRAHDLRAVAWGGWMESDPVQVRLLLAHEDFDDPCDALIRRELRFDLASLRAAYRAAYGTAPPGETTLVLLLEDPLMAGPLSARVLNYTF